MIFHVGNNEKPICSHKIYRQPPYFNTKKRFSDSLWSPLPRSIFPMPRHGTNHPNAKPNVPCYARAFLRGQVFFDLTISYYMLFNLCYSIYITSYYMISSYTTFYDIKSYHIILYSIILILYYSIVCYITLCHIMIYYTILYYDYSMF